MAAEKQVSRRLFFALWPNDDVRQQLAVLIHQSSAHNTGKSISAMNLHLTLVFLGNVEEAHIECLRDVAGSIQANSFRLQLDKPGWFKKPRVAWMGTDHPPDVLLSLVSQLREVCIKCGLRVEDGTFRPHVSLQRKVQRFQSFDVTPVEWDVDSFVLVQSHTHPQGVEYRVIDRWPLLEESL